MKNSKLPLPLISTQWIQKQFDVLSAQLSKQTNSFIQIMLASEMNVHDKEDQDFAYVFTDQAAYNHSDIGHETTFSIFTFEEKTGWAGGKKTMYGFCYLQYEEARQYKDGSGTPPNCDQIESDQHFDRLIDCVEYLVMEVFRCLVQSAIFEASYDLIDDNENEIPK